jgi:hypothetical protein
MAILGDLGVTAIGQTADGAGQKLPAARAFALALLGFGRNADGREFLAVAVQPAGEAQAEGAGIELVGLAFAVEGDGRDEKTLSAGGQEFAVEHKAEAATFLHADDLETFGDPLFDLGDELSRVNLRGACGLAWSFWATAMMNSRWTSSPSLSRGLAGSITAVGSGWRGGMIFNIAACQGSASALRLRVS